MLANVLLGLVLVTQLAPHGWGHAGLALSTALAALFNSALLLRKLLRDRIYVPQADWRFFLLRISLASVSMAGLLIYASDGLPWQSWTLIERVSHLAGWIVGGGAAYFACLWLSGLRPRHLALQEGICGMSIQHSAPEGT
jgi:putative peptidoglycan lipid II flippase